MIVRLLCLTELYVCANVQCNKNILNFMHGNTDKTVIAIGKIIEN